MIAQPQMTIPGFQASSVATGKTASDKVAKYRFASSRSRVRSGIIRTKGADQFEDRFQAHDGRNQTRSAARAPSPFHNLSFCESNFSRNLVVVLMSLVSG